MKESLTEEDINGTVLAFPAIQDKSQTAVMFALQQKA
jgi:hypothetical protein